MPYFNQLGSTLTRKRFTLKHFYDKSGPGSFPLKLMFKANESAAHHSKILGLARP